MADPATYTFLSWYRTGLATAIDADPAAGGERGSIAVRLKTKVGGAEEQSQAQRVLLVGPGDVIGIDPRAVVRVEPRPNANDFEPNYLAAIEFFDEDFAWRYSPRAPEGAGHARLTPWLALLVLEEGEFAWKDQGAELPRAITVPDASVLPPTADLWAWAHTHLNTAAADPNDARATAELLRRDPLLGLSRIVAARRLQPNRSYRALLVPAFEAGRRAGLLPGAAPVRTMAWDAAGNAELPVYFDWSFRTGEAGDFEELARRLHPVPPDPTVGRRPMNLARPLPGLAVPPIRDASAAPRPVLDLEGALQVPGAKPSPWQAASRVAFQQWLAGFVNLAEVWTVDASQLVDGAPALPNGIKLPIVLPPSYGRWHADIATLEPAQVEQRWLEQINLDPRNRVAAAFGTLVVQKNQEDFMARAWAQYGELFRANRFRWRAQFMREVLSATEAKHLAPLAEPKLLTTTSLAHPRVMVAEAVTVRGAIEVSALPLAAVQPLMRRVLRSGGPLARRFGGGVKRLDDIVQGVASTALRVAPAWTQPPERPTLATAPAAQAGDNSSAWLGADWDSLRPLIAAYLERTKELAVRVPQVGDIVPFLQALLARGDAQALLSTAAFTPERVAEVRELTQWMPPTLRERVNDIRAEDLALSPDNDRFSFAALNFRQAILNASAWLTQELPPQLERAALDMSATAAALRARLSPYASVAERVARVTQLPPVIKLASYDPLETIMAYPTFDDATYEHLKKISEEYVVPNLSRISNNSITLLEANWRFIESFLVGLNHEMARELLWRGYRTDQRGTCFAQFWDVRGVPGATKGDIQPVHGWRRDGKLTPLGENRPAGKIVKNNLVLVVRGDLLRRYPNTQVYAVRAVPNKPPPPREAPFTHVSRRPGNEVKQPVLFAKFEPDVYCFGFDLEKAEARGKPVPEPSDLGWYFVLAERVGEPRFGLDEPADKKLAFPQPPPAAHDNDNASDLDWADLVTNAGDYARLGTIDLARHHPDMPAGGFKTDPQTAASRRASWNTDAADMAAILLQTPFRLYFHANDMLLP